MRETDLFEPIKWLLLNKLLCYEVYGEILNFDVLGLSDNDTNIIVEMKTSLNFKVMEQALNALQYADYVYIATPKRKRAYGYYDPTKMLEKVYFNRYGIGLIEVDERCLEVEKESQYKHLIDTRIKAKYNRLPRKMKHKHKNDYLYEKHYKEMYDIRSHIKHYSHKNVGGISGNDPNKVSAFSETMTGVKRYLMRQYTNYFKGNIEYHWKTIDEILEHCETHYGSPKASLSNALRNGWGGNWYESKIDEIGRRVYRYVKE